MWEKVEERRECGSR